MRAGGPVVRFKVVACIAAGRSAGLDPPSVHLRKRCQMRRFVPFAAVGALISLLAMPLTAGPATGAAGPSVSSNQLVDLDHGLAFPQNKQNEPSITRDPLTGVLVAGANDEISQPSCVGT